MVIRKFLMFMGTVSVNDAVEAKLQRIKNWVGGKEVEMVHGDQTFNTFGF